MTNASGTPGPIRTCLGCSAKKAKSALVRLTLDKDGQAKWDPGQTQPGRGAYICPSRDCLNMVVKSKRLAAAFGRPVATDHMQRSNPPWEK